jgi:nitroimidazol reductase NimA-like FMN-containing flavoprotein (pyridoxamine 5'-phosphate oxidase superfamily)
VTIVDSKFEEQEMRRKQFEITEKKEITTILATTRVGRLATLGQDGYPYIIMSIGRR